MTGIVCFGMGIRVGKKKKNLTETHPELCEQWSDKNELGPECYTHGSHKKVWWVCEKGHGWQTMVNDRSHGCGCPYCSGRRTLVGFNDLQTINPELASEWHPNKNGKLLPTDVTAGSNKKVWWKCNHGHEWKARIADRSKKDSACPFCDGRIPIVGKTDLQTIDPELASEWHPTKNEKLLPTDVTAGSQKKVWWKCKHDHEWESTICNRNGKGNGCPFCSGYRPIVGKTDLQTVNPELASEWHPNKNGKLLPAHVAVRSNKKVWWICEKGHEWKASVDKRSVGRGCPVCNESRLEKNVANILGVNNIEHIREYTIPECKNKRVLPFDFYLPDHNTLIECQGIQHYPEEYHNSRYASSGRHTDEDIQQIQKHDAIKRQFCKDNGIKLIEIPYNDIDNIEVVLIRELGLKKCTKKRTL
jgi:hypothetical protein